MHPTIAAPVDVTPGVGLSNAEARRLLEELGPNATRKVTVHPVDCCWPVHCAGAMRARSGNQLFLKEYVKAGVIAVLLVFNAALGFQPIGASPADAGAGPEHAAIELESGDPTAEPCGRARAFAES